MKAETGKVNLTGVCFRLGKVGIKGKHPAESGSYLVKYIHTAIAHKGALPAPGLVVPSKGPGINIQSHSLADTLQSLQQPRIRNLEPVVIEICSRPVNGFKITAYVSYEFNPPCGLSFCKIDCLEGDSNLRFPSVWLNRCPAVPQSLPLPVEPLAVRTDNGISNGAARSDLEPVGVPAVKMGVKYDLDPVIIPQADIPCHLPADNLIRVVITPDTDIKKIIIIQQVNFRILSGRRPVIGFPLDKICYRNSC